MRAVDRVAAGLWAVVAAEGVVAKAEAASSPRTGSAGWAAAVGVEAAQAAARVAAVKAAAVRAATRAAADLEPERLVAVGGSQQVVAAEAEAAA